MYYRDKRGYDTITVEELVQIGPGAHGRNVWKEVAGHQWRQKFLFHFDTQQFLDPDSFSELQKERFGIKEWIPRRLRKLKYGHQKMVRA